MFEKVRDGEVSATTMPESIHQKQFVDELMNIRDKSTFYQKSVKDIFNKRNEFPNR